ncbi:hypothetical protein ASD71_09925 [Achromobacter sp. Root565]|nr:hypothetical protein ASD71_09925 [Achromobacter sp. Root565]
MPGLRHAAVQDASRLAGPHDARNGVVDGLLDHGMFRLAQIAHAGRQIGRSNEDAIHAVHGKNLVQRRDAVRRFDLHQHAHLVVGAFKVVGNAVPARRARQRTAHATDALRRIADRRHGGGGFLRGLDHGHQHRLRSRVQNLFDLHRVVPCRTHHGRDRIGGHGLQLGKGGVQRIGCVLAVDQQPVESGAGKDFRGIGAGQAGPQADLRFAVAQGLLERVGQEVHGLGIG